MGTELYVDLKHALGNKASVTVRIQDVERAIGEDWLLELSAQAHHLGARVDPHHTDATLLSVTRN